MHPRRSLQSACSLLAPTAKIDTRLSTLSFSKHSGPVHHRDVGSARNSTFRALLLKALWARVSTAGGAPGLRRRPASSPYPSQRLLPREPPPPPIRRFSPPLHRHKQQTPPATSPAAAIHIMNMHMLETSPGPETQYNQDSLIHLESKKVIC